MSPQYFSELNKYKNSQKQLERYQLIIIDQLSKIHNPEIQQLSKYFQVSRVTCDDTNLKLDLQDILDKLKYVQRAVILESGNNIPDLEAFQEDLINVINRIQDLKVHSQMKVNELSTEQILLNEDIELYTERLYVWMEPVRRESYQNEITNSKVDTTNSNMPNDVKRFMDFMKKSNGYENGWTPSDHHLFLKLRKKFPVVEELSEKLHEMLPDISIDEVKRHEAWYIKYLNLKEKHNETIKRWQKLKTGNADFVDPCENLEELEENPIKYHKTVEQKTNERNKIREEIQIWKKECEIVKNIQQTMKVEQIKQSKMKEKEIEQKNKIKKAMVTKWKESKLALQEEKMKCEKSKEDIERHVRVSVANKMIKYYQICDQVRYDKNINYSKKSDRTESKVISNYQVNRDPNRLFRPTQQWIQRFLANTDKNPIRPVNFIGRIPKLHKPFWRKNL